MDVNKMSLDVREGEEYEVIVAGGGPAGCAAAIAAAREGKKTLLIEASGVLGGMGTMGLVPWWSTGDEAGKTVYQGIAAHIIEKGRAATPHIPAAQTDGIAINVETLKRIYDEEVAGAGAQVLFESQIVHTVVKDGNVEAVVVANKMGLTVYRAAVFVDATGDGDVCTLSGAQCEIGREDQTLQPASHCFIMTNVDTYGYEHVLGSKMHNGGYIIQKMVKDPELDLINDLHFCNILLGSGAVGFNAGHIEDFDPLDPVQMSQKLMEGRQMAHQYELGLKKYAPEAFGAATLSQTGPYLGIRESRRIVCEYMLTVQDYIDRNSFDDEIGRSRYMVDIHRTKKEMGDPDSGKKTWFGYLGPGESYGIPYRSLIPIGVKNLLVAGRCIGSDSIINGSVRVMPVCLVTGEAAGTAAAFAAEKDGNVRNVDVKALQDRLESFGAYLHLK